MMEKYIRWDIIRSFLMSDCRKDFLNLGGSHLCLIVKFSRIVVLNSFLFGNLFPPYGRGTCFPN